MRLCRNLFWALHITRPSFNGIHLWLYMIIDDYIKNELKSEPRDGEGTDSKVSDSETMENVRKASSVDAELSNLLRSAKECAQFG